MKEEYRALLLLPLAWTLSTCVLVALVRHAPSMDNASATRLKFPSSMEDVRVLSGVLTKFKETHMLYVVTLFCVAYLYKQAFAIPGSAMLNVICGALYGPLFGTILVSICCSWGACLCYLLSYFCGKKLVMRLASDRLRILSDKMSENRGSLLYFLVSARLFPFTPNWLLNVASPILAIPLHYFFISVFFGLLPYNYMCVQAGSAVVSGVSVTYGDLMSPHSIMRMMFLTSLVLAFAFTRLKYSSAT